jgi:hypothetical protein
MKRGAKLKLTPETIWTHFLAYVKKTKSNPFIVTDWVGGVAKQVDRKKERPLTLEGFDNYCAEFVPLYHVDEYIYNRDGRYPQFIQVVTRIRAMIRQDQIEGGMAMIYSQPLTARLNNLVEKTENKNTVTTIDIVESSN